MTVPASWLDEDQSWCSWPYCNNRDEVFAEVSLYDQRSGYSFFDSGDWSFYADAV
jgi:hypothetical protein